jgi:serine/threonine protein kinase
MQGELKAGRYEIEREIGHGGMGVVYRARDNHLERTVALKVITPALLHDSQYLRRLSQEARAASAISHPGVATVYEFIDSEAEHFIVYEYVEGCTLREALRGRQIEAEEILDIGMQVADALAAAHEHRIVHRDIKPENIMLTPSGGGVGRVKILDFGLAKLHAPVVMQGSGTDAETRPVTDTGPLLMGTMNYMAPEQLQAQPADARTDIYAVGLLLYEIASGTNPFVGQAPSSTIANILTKEPPPLSARNPVAPAELDRILRKCLRKRKEERFQSARELWVDLANLRKELTRESSPGRSTPAICEQELPLAISRGAARGLFLLIQAAYLTLCALAAYFLPSSIHRTQAIFPGLPGSALLLLIVCAAAVHIYFFSAIGFDYPDSGRLFRSSFPILLLLDSAWAGSPLLLFREMGALSLLIMVALAFLPFAQRTLLFTAYAPGGGRVSSIQFPAPL